MTVANVARASRKDARDAVTAAESALARHSFDYFSRWEERVGGDPRGQGAEQRRIW